MDNGKKIKKIKKRKKIAKNTKGKGNEKNNKKKISYFTKRASVIFFFFNLYLFSFPLSF